MNIYKLISFYKQELLEFFVLPTDCNKIYREPIYPPFYASIEYNPSSCQECTNIATFGYSSDFFIEEEDKGNLKTS